MTNGPEPIRQIDNVSGLIERVTFFNEETGFVVLKVKAKGHRELVSVVGSLPAVNAGEWIVAEGVWVRDKDHGLQLKAGKLTCTPPTTRAGIEKYLGSGMVKGIGPVYAGKLVGQFGEKIFDIIENFSARLQEIEGIGPERRKRIKEAWTEQKFIRQIMVFLHSHGVSTSRAVRIFKMYGEAAIDTVRANPYQLARDIPGIGFRTADQIAGNVGIPRDSLLRAAAGVAHQLGEGVGDGHCALPKTALATATAKMLEVNEAVVADALDRELAKGELVQEEIEGEMLIFLPALRNAEARIAARLLALAEAAPNYPAIQFEKAVEWCQARTGKVLAPSQRAALETVLKHRIAVITGGPGVGKTTLINALLLILGAKKVRCLLAAPTGRAAKRMSQATGREAQTIHRLLEFQPGAGGFTRNERRPIECDLLIVDEASMIDVPLMDHLLRAHPAGASLVMVGDVDQLPSVGPGAVLGDVIRSGKVPVVQLTEVFRQAAGSRIIQAAHEINQGVTPGGGHEESADFFFIEREDAEAISQMVIEMVKIRIPRKFGLDAARDIQVLCPMNRGSLGTREMNLRLQAALNPVRENEAMVEKFGWQFRLRDRVIQTENDYDKNVFNGDLGQITKIDAVEREATIRFDDREVTYDFGELDEVSLAYAISVHKAQGSEFPAVVIPIAMQQYVLLQRNLLYTGVTRGQRLVVLVGQKKALTLAVRNHRTVPRCSGLRVRMVGWPMANSQ